MALKFKIGDKVRQTVKVIEGTVTDAAIIDGDVQFKVSYAVDGVPHERHFTDEQIEAAAAAPVAVQAAPAADTPEA